jgi:HK97 family phage major capsid protein
MSRTRQELESEIRAVASQSNLSGADERRLAELTRELSSNVGHPITVTRGDRSTCISTDVTPRGSRPTSPAKTTHRHTCEGCHGSGVLDVNDPVAMSLLAPAARHAIMAQARAAVPATPAHRSPATRSAMARAAGVYGLTRDSILEPDVLLRAPYGEVRDFALAQIERHSATLTPAAQDRLEELCRTRTSEQDGRIISQHVAITSSPAYCSAFSKALRFARPDWDRGETLAIQRYRELRSRIESRAMTEGGTTGLAIPVLIDPSIILTTMDKAEILSPNGGCKTVVITTNAWKGVSSAGVTLAFDAEDVAAPDAGLTLAQPVIPVYKADGVITVSLEMAQDYPSFSDEALTLFNGALADNISNYTAVGSGTNVPTGIFTAMSSTTTPPHVKVTTAGSICGNDIRSVFGSLAERYRQSASWLMSPSVAQEISALAAPSVSNGLAPHDWVPGYATQPTLLLGRPVLISSYAPAFSSTTGAANYCVVGDFSRFLLVSRVGTGIELLPSVPNLPASNLPTGQRALYYQSRWGSGPTDVLAFRILSD